MSNFVPVHKPSFLIEENDTALKITTCMSNRGKILAYFILAFYLLMAVGLLFYRIFVFTTNDYYGAETRISFLDANAPIILLLIILACGLSVLKKTFKSTIEITDHSVTILEGDYFSRPKKYTVADIKNLRGSTYKIG